jgi:hypothetical protein
MPELLVLAFLYIKVKKNITIDSNIFIYIHKMHHTMQLKTLSFNFSKFYTNIIYELLRN